MDKCISSCSNIDHLEVMMDWIERVMTKSVFPNDDVSPAKILLFKGLLKQKEKIEGIGEIEEIDLKAPTLHPQ